ADNRRVAQLLPNLNSFGWVPHLVSFDSNPPPRAADGIDTRTVGVPRASWWNLIGVRSPGFVGASEFDRVVRKWHREQPFDLALFSNTRFELWRLGPDWKRDLGLKYVLDWQDPWVSDYHD